MGAGWSGPRTASPGKFCTGYSSPGYSSSHMLLFWRWNPNVELRRRITAARRFTTQQPAISLYLILVLSYRNVTSVSPVVIQNGTAPEVWWWWSCWGRSQTSWSWSERKQTPANSVWKTRCYRMVDLDEAKPIKKKSFFWHEKVPQKPCWYFLKPVWPWRNQPVVYNLSGKLRPYL